jgi:hypothetical protein
MEGAEFRECNLNNTRLIGVIMQDAVIDGLVSNLVVNGVEVMKYVEAELDRRHPVRRLIRSEDLDDLRRGWRQLRADWAATVARMRHSPGIEHESVNDEWSAVQTLRHLVFVHDSWFRRCCLGSTDLFTPMGLASSPCPAARSRGSTRQRTRRSTRCWRSGTNRRPNSSGGWTPSPPSGSRSRHRSPTTTCGRRTHADDRCGNAWAWCSARVRAPSVLRARPRPHREIGRWLTLIPHWSRSA